MAAGGPRMIGVTGGCQCGAIRFRIGRLGRSSVCHCRMCQKATGAVFGVFVTAHDVIWTRGEPARFRSSNLGERLFCASCGTPLAVEEGAGNFEFATGCFDDPMAAPPVIQVHTEGRLPFFEALAQLPPPPDYDATRVAAHEERLVSYQHPDHDTETWPSGSATKGQEP